MRPLFSKRNSEEPEELELPDLVEDNQDLERIRDVLHRSAMGDLDARVTGVNPQGPLGAIADDLNRLLDLTESFTRETEATLAAARAGRSYRKFLLRGMLGDFARSAHEINAALDTVSAAARIVRRTEKTTSPLPPGNPDNS